MKIDEVCAVYCDGGGQDVAAAWFGRALEGRFYGGGPGRLILFAVLLAWLCLFTIPAFAEAEADALMKRIAERDRGEDLVWDIGIDLIDRSGDMRQRTGKIFRRELEDGRSEQVTVFLSPNNIRHTALLDVEAASGDVMWLYVPALKVTKRVPPADRGDKFVGTDFTMEDVDLGFAYEDYTATVEGRGEDDGHPTATLRIRPKTEQLARELGWDESVAVVRVDQAVIVDQRFFRRDRAIRHNRTLDIRVIDGILTPMELRSADLVNDHRTVLWVRKAAYDTGVSSAYFRKEALARERYR